MISDMLLLSPLCILLYWMLPVDSMGIRLEEANQALPLTMVENAVDDMYVGCKEPMAKMVKNKYFIKENTGKFAVWWKKAGKCVERAEKQKDPKDQALTNDHLQAICVYTSNNEGFYKTFNEAVRSSRSTYNTSFPHHALHFWLTTAVQILSKKKCITTYRRTDLDFTGRVNQKIRFGFFASSSYSKTLTQFGKKSCFKIRTCFGAYLKKYPYLGDKEQEVLIPPYEVFKITGIKKGRDVKQQFDCDILYVLKSISFLSNLNCKAVKL
ncbi:ecto-ADP-ribosyltransferase 5-like [Channa argus]